MDVLSDILKLVSVKGAVFYNAEFTAPWSFNSPKALSLAPHLAPGAEHLVIYHLLVEGVACARVGTGAAVDLQAGDIVIFPHGDEHVMGNGPPTTPVDTSAEIQRFVAQGLRAVRVGGGGEVTKLVCGYMACDPHISRVTLAALPPFLKVNIRSDPAGVWLENSIRFSAEHASAVADGSEAVLAKFSEALFVETLRRYIADMPPGQKGWLAGARDPQVGKALGLLHRDPAHPWQIADLAAAVGVSRAVLADRFRYYVGEGPMGYLAKWRMLLGARLLSTSTATIAELAMQVGYDSEAAFNRAFKREFGVPPARYRRQTRSAAAGGV